MPPRFPKPCLECGQLSLGNYCEQHGTRNQTRSRAKEQAKERSPGRVARKRALYNSEYKKIAKAIREQGGICHICKEIIPPGGAGGAVADHLVPGDPSSPLAPAHEKCNSSRGNKPLTNP